MYAREIVCFQIFMKIRIFEVTRPNISIFFFKCKAVFETAGEGGREGGSDSFVVVQLNEYKNPPKKLGAISSGFFCATVRNWATFGQKSHIGIYLRGF